MHSKEIKGNLLLMKDENHLRWPPSFGKIGHVSSIEQLIVGPIFGHYMHVTLHVQGYI